MHLTDNNCIKELLLKKKNLLHVIHTIQSCTPNLPSCGECIHIKINYYTTNKII